MVPNNTPAPVPPQGQDPLQSAQSGLPSRIFQAKRRLFIDRPRESGITIDGPYSKDLDDALWVKRDGLGWMVAISIADVGLAFAPNSELDLAARERAFTRYRAQGTEPMLPPQLSELGASLLPGYERPTITIRVPFSSRFSIGAPAMELTYIESQRKYDYQTATHAIREKQSLELVKLSEIAHSLFEQRQRRGAIAYIDLARGLYTNEMGQVQSSSPHYALAQVLVQEFMILANEIAASYFRRNAIPGIYRNHRAASGLDRNAFVQQLSKLIALHHGDWAAQEYRALCAGLGRASYGVESRGHFALNTPNYMHFTSPIRRYPDLVNHWMLSAHLGSQGAPLTTDELNAICAHVSSVEEEFKTNGKEAREERLRRQALRAVAQQYQGTPLEQVPESDYTKLLRLEVKRPRPMPELAEDIVRRSSCGALGAAQIVPIILEAPPGPEWTRIKQAIYTNLASQPAAAVSVLYMLCQKHALGEPQLSITAQAEGFIAQARIRLQEQELISGPRLAKRKDLASAAARQELALLLLAAFRPDELETLKSAAIEQTYSQNETSFSHIPNRQARSILREICQERAAQGWSPPEYFLLKSEGPGNAPTFTVQASVRIQGTNYAAQGSGTKKAAAEEAATQALLEELTRKGLIPTPESGRLSANTGQASANKVPNYAGVTAERAKSALMEFCARYGETPQFTITAEGPPHQPRFRSTAKLSIEGKWYETPTPALGSQSKAAEHHASFLLLCELAKAGLLTLEGVDIHAPALKTERLKEESRDIDATPRQHESISFSRLLPSTAQIVVELEKDGRLRNDGIEHRLIKEDKFVHHLTRLKLRYDGRRIYSAWIKGTPPEFTELTAKAEIVAQLANTRQLNLDWLHARIGNARPESQRQIGQAFCEQHSFQAARLVLGNCHLIHADWHRPAYEWAQVGAYAAGIDLARVTVQVGEEKFSSELAEGRSPAQARENAALDLIGRMVNQGVFEKYDSLKAQAAIKADGPSLKPESQTIAQERLLLPLQTLRELCRCCNWPDPVMEVVNQEEQESPGRVSMRACIEIAGKRYQGEIAAESQPEWATERAAMQLISELEKQSAAAGEPLLALSQDRVERLRHLCTRYGIGQPEFNDISRKVLVGKNFYGVECWLRVSPDLVIMSDFKADDYDAAVQGAAFEASRLLLHHMAYIHQGLSRDLV